MFQFAYVIAGAVQQLACLPQRRFVVECDVVGQWFGQVPVEAVRGDQRQPFRWVEFFQPQVVDVAFAHVEQARRFADAMGAGIPMRDVCHAPTDATRTHVDGGSGCAMTGNLAGKIDTCEAPECAREYGTIVVTGFVRDVIQYLHHPPEASWTVVHEAFCFGLSVGIRVDMPGV